jgi:hypothetical protein
VQQISTQEENAVKVTDVRAYLCMFDKSMQWVEGKKKGFLSWGYHVHRPRMTKNIDCYYWTTG